MTPTIETPTLLNSDRIPVSEAARALASSAVSIVRNRVGVMATQSVRPGIRDDARRAIAEAIDTLRQLDRELARKQ